MPPFFVDRREAGRRLADRLRVRGYENPFVLALPRGGVPVAHDVAQALHAPLALFFVRPLIVPAFPELTMGAIASGGVRLLYADIIARLHLSNEVIQSVTVQELRTLTELEREYRGSRPFPSLRRATAIIVDDGAATPAALVTAVRAVKQLKPAQVVAAAPVMSASARADILSVANECIAVATGELLDGVAPWYLDFALTTDVEMHQLVDADAAVPTVSQKE